MSARRDELRASLILYYSQIAKLGGVASYRAIQHRSAQLLIH